MPTTTIPTAIATVRALPGEHYLCHEVADALDVSAATLRRLGRREPVKLGPTTTIVAGGKPVAVFDMAAVERIAAHLEQGRSAAGRPRLWTDTERRLRRMSYNGAGYLRRRAETLRAQGRDEEADRLDEVVRRVLDELRDDHRLRTEAVRARRCDVTTQRK